MTDDKFYEELSNLINNAFDGAFGRKTPKLKLEKPMVGEKYTKAAPALTEQKPEKTTNDSAREHFPNLYESIEDYTVQTGKRFRMTKEQKSRELSREEAFNEMYLGGTN